MSEQQGDPAGGRKPDSSPQFTAAGNDRVQVEFQMDDLIRRLLPPQAAVGHCAGCNGCSGCKHFE